MHPEPDFPNSKPIPSGISPLKVKRIFFGFNKNNFEFYGDTLNHYSIIYTGDNLKLNINDQSASLTSKYLDYNTSSKNSCYLNYNENDLKLSLGLGYSSARLLFDKDYGHLITSWDIGLGKNRYVKSVITRKNPRIQFGYHYSPLCNSLFFGIEQKLVKFQTCLTLPKFLTFINPSYIVLKLRTPAGNASVGFSTIDKPNTFYNFFRLSKSIANTKFFFCIGTQNSIAAGGSTNFMQGRLQTKLYTVSKNLIANVRYQIGTQAIVIGNVGFDIPKRQLNYALGIKCFLN